MKSIIAAAGLVAVAQAYTQPVQPPTYGSLLTPDINTPVTTGQDYTITWTPKQPADGVTVSLVLCNGPSTNCVLQSSAIVEGVPAGQGSYKWSVPCGLPAGVQATSTGYGMLIIVDGTGEFQYSTQFSVNTGASCGSSSSSSSSSTSTTSSSISSTSSTSSVSTTSSSSSSPTSGSATDGWFPWATVSSSSFSTSTVPVQTTTSAYTSAPAVTTSKPAETTYSYSKPSTTAAAASSVATTPKAFTGAAAVPTAFVNAAGIVGAAALAALAL